MSDMIGGCENDLLDYSETEEEYINAKNFLGQSHNEMIEFFYRMTMNDVKDRCEEARFAGGQFLKNWLDKELTEWGY